MEIRDIIHYFSNLPLKVTQKQDFKEKNEFYFKKFVIIFSLLKLLNKK